MSNILGETILIKNNLFYLKGYQDFFNKRLKIEDFRGSVEYVIKKITELSEQDYVEKVIIKSRLEFVPSFIEKGYVIEAAVPGYFLGGDGFFLCKYKEINRYNSDKWCEEDTILEGVWNKVGKLHERMEQNLVLRRAEVKDAEELSGFYSKVFPIYPVPIEDPAYVQEQIEGDVIFIIIEDNGKIIASASAEINMEYRNAEITDCATLPSHRKGGYMSFIIQELEKQLQERQVYCSYSIARALSFGMNAVLHNLQYTYKGRMKNNCYIFDKIEDMNVWSKDLSTNIAEKSAPVAGN
jgi:putative beta-lysine N-acetyltransferase